MADRFKTQDSINDFSAGLVTDREGDTLPANAATVFQNLDLDGGRALAPRKGSTILGTYVSGGSAYTSAHNYRRDDDQERPLMFSGTVLYYYNPYTDTIETLQTAFTSGQVMGFADGDDGFCYIVSPNQAIRRWSGAVARVDSATSSATVIGLKAQGSLTTAALFGFSSTGTVIVSATTYAYTGISGLTLTGVTGFTAVDADDCAETPITTGFTSGPNGTMAIFVDGSLKVAGDPSNPTILYYSKFGSPRDFSFSTPAVADDGGQIKFPHAITGLVDKGSYIAVVTEDEIFSVIYTDFVSTSNTIIQIPKIVTITSGVNVGAVNAKGKSVRPIDYNAVYQSRNVGVRLLTRLENKDYDEPTDLTDLVRPDAEAKIYTDGVVTVWKRKIVAFHRTDSDVTGNNEAFLIDRRDKWVSILKGWNGSCSFVYDKKLYMGDAFSRNIWQLFTDTYSDYDKTDHFPYTVRYRSGWRMFFDERGNPAFDRLKELKLLFIDGYITPNTTLDVKLDFDLKNGTTTAGFKILGTGGYVQPAPSAALGINPFGIHGFVNVDGSSSGLRRFRCKVWIDNEAYQFFACRYGFESNTASYNWRVTKVKAFADLLPPEHVEHETTLNVN